MKNYSLLYQEIGLCKKNLFFLMVVFFHSQAIAESLPDPTRPYSAEAPAAVQTGPILQSVLISPSQQVAIINGKRVALGDQYADTQLVSLSDGEAVLKGKHGSQTLTLFPGNKYGIKSNKQPAHDAPVINTRIAQHQ